MERLARQRGLDFESSSLDEKEELWEEAKGMEWGSGGGWTGFLDEVGDGGISDSAIVDMEGGQSDVLAPQGRFR